ncbi:MAG: HEAT repeat domain-containing protein [Planctomycetes bacterium]|nr:HEAT repeat domain-containing protein [Planctomycetota bacterium]
MEENLELYFCDLCNASVAQRDLDTGRARRVSGKVLGACCLDPLREEFRDKGRGGFGLLGAGLALVALAGATLFLDWRGAEEAEATRLGVANVAGATAAMEARLREFEGRLAPLASREEVAGVATRMAGLEKLRADGDQRVRLVEQSSRAQAQDLLKALQDLAEGQLLSNQQQARIREQVGQLASDVAAIRAAPRAPAAPEESALRERPPALPAEAAPPGLPPELAHQVTRLKDADPNVRYEAVDALVKSKNQLAREALLGMVKDSDPFVRRRTLEGLPAFRHASSVDALVTALADPEALVRDMAYASLKTLTGASLPFDANGSREERAAQQRRWREWFTENRGAF